VGGGSDLKKKGGSSDSVNRLPWGEDKIRLGGGKRRYPGGEIKKTADNCKKKKKTKRRDPRQKSLLYSRERKGGRGLNTKKKEKSEKT